jgi:opacity protein-like surface antigen
MIRFARAMTTLVFLAGSIVFAQDETPRVQVFGGYSLLHADSGKLNGSTLDVDLRQFPNTFDVRTNFNGWNVEAQYNFGSWVGVAADFSGYNGSPFIVRSPSPVSGLPDGNSYSILAGPVVSYRALKRFTPFAHALFGWNRTSLNASTFTHTSFPVASVSTHYDDFTLALGGGVDYRVFRYFSLRFAQVDWFHTSVNLNSFYGTAFNTTVFQGLATRERNLRVSAGIVVNF